MDREFVEHCKLCQLIGMKNRVVLLTLYLSYEITFHLP